MFKMFPHMKEATFEEKDGQKNRWKYLVSIHSDQYHEYLKWYKILKN